MATVTPSKTFTSNEIVTPANLNLLGTPTVALADGEVTTSKILDANVTSSKIANLSVTVGKLGTTEQTRIAKAWVNFDGTTSPGTIRSSYNVSSITKNATGDYTVNFATPMADANYSVVGSCGNTFPASASYNAVVPAYSVIPTTSQVRISTGFTNTPIDTAVVHIQVFGN